MDRIELFDTVPVNYTYNREDELNDIAKIEKTLEAFGW